MIKLRVGGVPEHFNLPWHLALEAHRFESLDIELTWQRLPRRLRSHGNGSPRRRARRGVAADRGRRRGHRRRRCVQDREPLHRLAARLGHPRTGDLAFPLGSAICAVLATRSAAFGLGLAPHGIRARAGARVGPSSTSRSSRSAISLAPSTRSRAAPQTYSSGKSS